MGRWGQLFLDSLERNDPHQFRELQASGELNQVTQSVDELASAEFEQTIDALLEKEKATGSADFGNNLAIVGAVSPPWFRNSPHHKRLGDGHACLYKPVQDSLGHEEVRQLVGIS